MDTKHTPARCKNCKWIHEADSTKGTSYMGVELCPRHTAAPELLEALESILEESIEEELWHGMTQQNNKIAAVARAAIAKAKGE